MAETDALAAYYDDLARFELSRRSLVMHKSFAAKPSLTEWLRPRIEAEPVATLLDVGCGFGVTLRALRPNGVGHGVTISQFQQRACTRLHRDRPELTFFAGSYEDALPGTYDAMLAIESLVFASDLERTVLNLARHLSPGGRLFVTEDMSLGRANARWERSYRAGFHLHRVYLVEDFERAFARAGLQIEQSVDLSPSLPRRQGLGLRLRAGFWAGLRALAPSRRWANVASAYWGGSFLERLYAEGSFAYRHYTLRKTGASG